MKINNKEITNPLAVLVAAPGLAWMGCVILFLGAICLALMIPALPFLAFAYAIEK